MQQSASTGISRQRLLVMTGLVAGGALLDRQALFAKGLGAGIVPTMIDAATKKG